MSIFDLLFYFFALYISLWGLCGLSILFLSRKRLFVRNNAKREMSRVVKITFHEGLDLPRVRAMAEAILSFSSAVQNGTEAKRRGVDKVFFGAMCEADIESALKSNSAKKIAYKVAEARLNMGETSHAWENADGKFYKAGWSDVTEFSKH